MGEFVVRYRINDAKYGDDDLTAGFVKPYRLFLIFNELADALAAAARKRPGGAIDPVAAFRASRYREQVSEARGRRVRSAAKPLIGYRTHTGGTMRERAQHMLAVDLGAASGRAVLGRFDGERMETQEVHRFSTPIVEGDGHIRWDIHAIEEEIGIGLKAALAEAPGVRSVSVDSWGVDYVLLDADGCSGWFTVLLPGSSPRRSDGDGVRNGSAGGYLRIHRHLLLAVQHAVPVGGRFAKKVCKRRIAS